MMGRLINIEVRLMYILNGKIQISLTPMLCCVIVHSVI